MAEVEIKASLVKELRDITGCGMMDCKRALQQTNGDIDKAVKNLRESGMMKAEKKASRIAAEGIVETYQHMGGRIGVLVEINSETDFVAKNEEFKKLAHNVAMHIAAFNPKYVRREEIPAADIAEEREVQRNITLKEGKPEKIVDKIVDGRMEKFYKANCLEEQDWLLNEDITVLDAVKEVIVKTGENIKIRRFVRFEKGEGLEKRKDDFAEEVMKQAGQA